MSAPAWLATIRARCAAATGGRWTYGRHQSMSKDEMIAYLINCVEVSPLTDAFYLVGAPDRAADVCHTGNGPTSERNADFIAHARADLPALLALAEALAGALDDVVVLTETDGQRCWCGWRVDHAPYCVRTRAALARWTAGPGATTGTEGIAE